MSLWIQILLLGTVFILLEGLVVGTIFWITDRWPKLARRIGYGFLLAAMASVPLLMTVFVVPSGW